MNNYKYLIVFIQKNQKFNSKFHFPSISMRATVMTKHLAIGEKVKIFRTKRPRGVNEPPSRQFKG